MEKIVSLLNSIFKKWVHNHYHGHLGQNVIYWGSKTRRSVGFLVGWFVFRDHKGSGFSSQDSFSNS